MAISFSYEPVDATFFETAPVVTTMRQVIPASAEATFRCFEDPDSWPVWMDPVDKVVWTSPLGANATRDITTQKFLTVTEQFFRWEEGRRFSFHFSSGQVPLFRSFAEDYLLEPRGDDECEFVWTYALTGRGPLSRVATQIGAQFGKGAAPSLGQLAEYMRKHRDRYAV